MTAMSISETAIKQIFTLVKDMKFGEVIIKVQDGCVVSVEKLEKIRFHKITDSVRDGEANINS